MPERNLRSPERHVNSNPAIPENPDFAPALDAARDFLAAFDEAWASDALLESGPMLKGEADMLRAELAKLD